MLCLAVVKGTTFQRAQIRRAGHDLAWQEGGRKAVPLKVRPGARAERAAKYVRRRWTTVERFG